MKSTPKTQQAQSKHPFQYLAVLAISVFALATACTPQPETAPERNGVDAEEVVGTAPKLDDNYAPIANLEGDQIDWAVDLPVLEEAVIGYYQSEYPKATSVSVKNLELKDLPPLGKGFRALVVETRIVDGEDHIKITDALSLEGKDKQFVLHDDPHLTYQCKSVNCTSCIMIEGDRDWTCNSLKQNPGVVCKRCDNTEGSSEGDSTPDPLSAFMVSALKEDLSITP